MPLITIGHMLIWDRNPDVVIWIWYKTRFPIELVEIHYGKGDALIATLTSSALDILALTTAH